MLIASDLHIETIPDLPAELMPLMLPVILDGGGAPPAPFFGAGALESMVYIFVF